MGERWIAEAEDLKAVGTSGVMEGGAPRVTAHVTVSPSGGSYFDAMHRVLTSNKSEPHLLYDPLTDRLGQYFALDRSARALANDGTRRTNGHGTVNIQIEFVAQPDGFTRYWKPGPNYRAMLRAIRSWGIPDVWPAGRLSKSYADKVTRSWATYSKAGWFGHCHVPGNDHWDPGPIDPAALFLKSTAPAAAPATPALIKEWFDMPIPDDEIDRIALRVWQYKNTKVTQRDAYAHLIAAGDPKALASALSALLPKSGPVTDVQLEAALRKVLGSVDN